MPRRARVLFREFTGLVILRRFLKIPSCIDTSELSAYCRQRRRFFLYLYVRVFDMDESGMFEIKIWFIHVNIELISKVSTVVYLGIQCKQVFYRSKK